MPSILGLRQKKQEFLASPGEHRQFKASLRYTKSPCLKQASKQMNTLGFLLYACCLISLSQKCKRGDWEMAQWAKHLSHKLEDQNLGPPAPHIKKLCGCGSPLVVQHSEAETDRQTDDIQSQLASQTGRTVMLWTQERDLASMTKVDRDQGRHWTSTSGLHIHMHVHLYTDVNTHTHMCTHHTHIHTHKM